MTIDGRLTFSRFSSLRLRLVRNRRHHLCQIIATVSLVRLLAWGNTDHSERQSALPRSFSSRCILALELNECMRENFPFRGHHHLPTDPSAFALLVLAFFLGALGPSSSSWFGRFGGAGGICIKNGIGITCGRNGGGRYASIPGTGLA